MSSAEQRERPEVNVPQAQKNQALRAGRLVTQLTGYRAFIPEPLPPNPPINFDGELLTLLSNADRDLARLDALAALLPNPDLFVAMYVKQEAVLSSQIEGTQSTLEDVLAFEAEPAHATATATHSAKLSDVGEVVNYVRAMNFGLERLATLPLSLRLIREIHFELMQGTRGQERTPGEFRTSQNWIGPPGATLKNAAFVPPPAHELMAALAAFETFLHEHQHDTPLLVRCGLAHAQFETIHPFLDGNGRVGRLLITFMLCEARALSLPLLYLSIYLKANRAEYYDRLMAVRLHGHWEAWLKFFLRGVSVTARLATDTGRKIIALRELHRSQFAKNANALKLIDTLLTHPYIDINFVTATLGCAFVTAGKIVQQLVAAGLLQETTGQSRNRVYRYRPYLELFDNQSVGAGHVFDEAR
jgi:Fic family protein